MIRMKFILLIVIVMLVGCESIDQKVDRVVDEAEKVVEGALDKSESVVCERASVRSVFKKYSGQRFQDWMNFCYPKMDVVRSTNVQ